MALKMPVCGWKRYVQNVPTTAGDSIIGRTMRVVHKPLVRKFLLMSQASIKPSNTWNASDQNTKCAVAWSDDHTTSWDRRRS